MIEIDHLSFKWRVMFFCLVWHRKAQYGGRRQGPRCCGGSVAWYTAGPGCLSCVIWGSYNLALFPLAGCVPAHFAKHSCAPSFWAAHLLACRKIYNICKQKQCLLIGLPRFHPRQLQATLNWQVQLPWVARRFPWGWFCWECYERVYWQNTVTVHKKKRTYYATEPRNSTVYSQVPSTGILPGNHLHMYKHPLFWHLAGCIFNNFAFLWVSRKHAATYKAGKERSFSATWGKAAARTICRKSFSQVLIRWEQRIQSEHLKPHETGLHSFFWLWNCLLRFLHPCKEKSLETLQAYSVNQDLLDHITKSLEPARLFSTKAL